MPCHRVSVSLLWERCVGALPCHQLSDCLNFSVQYLIMEPIFPHELQTQLQTIIETKTKSQDGSNIMMPFIQLFNVFLSNLDAKFDAFEKKMFVALREKDMKIEELEETVVAQRKCIVGFEEKLERQCQYTRRESLVFSGKQLPAHTDNENCLDIVCKIISEKIDPNLNIQPADISVAHRLGSKSNAGTDGRSIIARFCRRKLKYDVLNRAKQIKPRGLYVSESLTPLKQKMVRMIRSAKEAHPNVISGFSTSDGTIHMWVKPPNPAASGAKNARITVETMARLEKFCQDHFGQPASTFDRPRASSVPQ